ncbi:hypothetical protein PG995_004873 [Apiospora arundinis]|uniref:Uncharacterized protein n=1 Tax=Apiospora arundinis TaxID=335852 RepID=A0ABR2IWZ8_9PEZI
MATRDGVSRYRPPQLLLEIRFKVQDPNAQRRPYSISANRHQTARMNTVLPTARGMGETAAYSSYH